LIFPPVSTLKSRLTAKNINTAAERAEREVLTVPGRDEGAGMMEKKRCR
jgi:hypothetical protein